MRTFNVYKQERPISIAGVFHANLVRIGKVDAHDGKEAVEKSRSRLVLHPIVHELDHRGREIDHDAASGWWDA